MSANGSTFLTVHGPFLGRLLSARIATKHAGFRLPRRKGRAIFMHESPVGIGTKHVDVVASAAFGARRADFNYSWVW